LTGFGNNKIPGFDDKVACSNSAIANDDNYQQRKQSLLDQAATYSIYENKIEKLAYEAADQ